MALKEKQRKFAYEYARLGNVTQAALAAGYSPRSAHELGSRLLKNVDVQDALGRARREVELARHLNVNEIATLWKEAATTDRNELMEVRRTCCRYCHGAGHFYQETPAEQRARRARYDATLALILKESKAGAPIAHLADFDTMGGCDFDRRKDPNKDCPECFGDGDMHVIIKDTRKLSKAARMLYEGVKITQNGIELKVMDRATAIQRAAENLGMFKKEHVLMNPDGSALDMRPTQVVFVGVKAGTDG